MAAIATTVPVEPRRARPNGSRVNQAGASEALQSDRMDVLVHMRALDQLDPRDPLDPKREHLRVDDGVDWVLFSDRYAALDGERAVGDIVAAARAGRPLEQPITFASGGKLLAGATSAAASLFYHLETPIAEGSGSTPDRSQHALRNDGFSLSVLQQLAVQWLLIDSTAYLLLLSVDDPDFDGAHHELSSRFDRFHTELDHLGGADMDHLGLVDTCSTQIVALRAGSGSIDNVLERHPSVIASASGRAALAMAGYLFSSDRSTTTCREHACLERSNRRSELVAQLFERARGRRGVGPGVGR